MKGRVFRSTGSWYDVRDEKGNTWQCRLKGVHKQKELKVTNPIAVGDQVIIIPEPNNANRAIIQDIVERENYIIRRSTRKSGHAHIIAANVSQAAVMATFSFPRTSLGFIDRFLVSAETFRVPAIIIFNKADLMDERALHAYAELVSIYTPLGYSCFKISADTGEGLETLMDMFKGKTTLLSGHSGVGKSTLLNKLHPRADQKTGEVSGFSEKGKHTTTFAEMFEIAPDSFLIDTPGIKELGLVDVEDEELSHFFPEMRKHLGQCKYYNCTHVNEPGCAVKNAVAIGEISESRYYGYLSILEDDDGHR